MDIHNLKLDWVSSEALARMEWDKRLPNTVSLWIALPFLNLGEQNELRLDKFGIFRLHSTWTFTIWSWIGCPVKLWLEWNGINAYRTLYLFELPYLFWILENKMSLDWTNLVSLDSIQHGHSQSEVGLGVKWSFGWNGMGETLTEHCIPLNCLTFFESWRTKWA